MKHEPIVKPQWFENLLLILMSVSVLVFMFSLVWWLNDISQHRFNAILFIIAIISFGFGCWMMRLYDPDEGGDGDA